MNARMFNGNNLPHELLLTTRETTKLRNTTENNMSTDIKLSKDQISKTIQSRGFLDKLLGPLLRTGIPLMKNVIKPLAKSVLAILGLTAAMSAVDAEIQRKIFGPGTTALVISNEEMNDIMKIVQALEDSNILLKGVTKTIKNETKEQKVGFIRKFINRRRNCKSRGRTYIRAGYGSSIKIKALILGNSLLHPLTNFEIEEYYENEPRFHGVYSRDNLPKTVKNKAYIINLDKYADAGPHWVVLYVKNNEVVYFDSFGVEHIPKEIKRFIGHKSVKTNIFRIQADNSIMCGYFCIGFIDFIFAGKNLIDFTSLFSRYDFKKNDQIILVYFK